MKHEYLLSHTLYPLLKNLSIPKRFFILLIFFFTLSNSFAATKTFTNVTATLGNYLWSTAANWGGTLPASGDAIIINGTCTVDNAANSPYTSTFTINAGKTLNWLTGTATPNLSVVNIASAGATATIDMTNGGHLIITGTTWTTTNLAFTPGTGTVEYQNTITMPAAYTTYYDLVINGSGKTITLGANTTINDDLNVTLGTLATTSLNISVTGPTVVAGTISSTTPASTKTFGSLALNGGTLTASCGCVTYNISSLTTSGTATLGGSIVLNSTTTNVNGGTLSFNSTTSTKALGSLSLTGGIITGSATANVTASSLTSTNSSAIGAINLTVAGTVTVSNGTLDISSATGTKNFGNLTVSGTFTNTANSSITINGNLTNNTSCSFGTGNVTFTGATNNTVSGSSIAFLGGITLSKGATNTYSDTANVLDVQCSISLGNTTATALTLNNGTFKLSSACTIVPFIQGSGTTNTLIPVSSKLWCANASAIMDKGSVSFDWGVAGVLQLDAGTINVGIASDNRIAPDAAGTCIIRINGGALNVAGRISFGTNGWSYIMTGGVLTVGIYGNTLTYSPFNMDNTSCYFSMTGGKIIIQQSGAGSSNLGYHNVGTLGSGFTGGTLQMGNASTPASNVMKIETDRPIYNLVVMNGLGTNTAQFITYATTITNDVTITSGVLDQGTNSIDISVGHNWNNNSSTTALVTGNRKVTFNGTTAQTIGGSFSTTFYNLTINNTTSPQTSATITLAATSGQHEYVNGLLTMTNGYIVSSTNNLLIMNSGSTTTGSSANSYVSGPMQKLGTTAFVFPVGSADLTKWARIGISAPTASTTFTATYFNTGYNYSTLAASPLPVFNNVSQVEYWTLDRTTGSGNAMVTLYWESNTYSGIGINNPTTACADLRIAHWNGSAWENPYSTNVTVSGCTGGAPGTTGTIVTTANVTSFSPFTFGSIASTTNPLPIELLSFNAAPCNDEVCLNWSTASEKNNDYFTIEKTKDAVNYDFVAKVAGAGNSTTRRNYSTEDNAPYEGVSYYRLKQTDYNGNFTYSNLSQVDFKSAFNNFSFNVYPNPSTGDNVSLAVNSDKGKEVLVVVYDVSGRETYSKVMVTEQKGKNVFALDPSGKLEAGIYMITATSDDSFQSKKLIVK